MVRQDRAGHRAVDGDAVELLAALALGYDGVMLNGLDRRGGADDDAGRLDMKAMAAAVDQFMHRVSHRSVNARAVETRSVAEK